MVSIYNHVCIHLHNRHLEEFFQLIYSMYHNEFNEIFFYRNLAGHSCLDHIHFLRNHRNCLDNKDLRQNLKENLKKTRANQVERKNETKMIFEVKLWRSVD